uniref:Uncharacterized protein n=1 Tax=Desertifilum tharense IPPAS B-1220 TaxID=1781255 RepID=A0ACD5GTN7_9CYAN
MTNLVTPEPLIASNRPSPGLIPRPAASEPPTNSGGGSYREFPRSDQHYSLSRACCYPTRGRE